MKQHTLLLPRHVSGLLVVALLLFACVGEERSCTAIGCGPTHETTLELESDAPWSELTLEACFNDECDSAPAPEENVGVGLELAGGKLWVGAASRGDQALSLSWNAAGSLAVKEGDRYAARLKMADGTTVAESVQIAESYSRSYPNGKECDGDGCLHIDSTRQAL